jgi:hypothetical protein
MKSMKTFLSAIILLSISFAQTAVDMEVENPASDNWQENYRSIEKGESSVSIYSNASIAEIFVWNVPWQSIERTFPAIISLPTDNRLYTISLFSQYQFQSLVDELESFNFENRDISEFEILQNELEIMKLGTKNVRPIPGAGESIFLTYCGSGDTNCSQGLNWLDRFYAKFYDQKQEIVLKSDFSGEKLTDAEKELVRKHRFGVASMVGIFSLAIILIDNSAL